MISKTKHITLERFAYTPYGTFGKLKVEDFECYTIERPWKNNERNVSCIPEGWYEMYYSRYNRGGYDAYEIESCVGRSEILIHIGNTMDDISGCIALGDRLGYSKKKWAVWNSTATFKSFMKAMNHEKEAVLKIKQYIAK